MRTIIIQKYLAPYRINLFNEINNLLGDSLLLTYYGKPEERRKWIDFPDVHFKKFESHSFSFKRNYERNITIPYSLFTDLIRLNPDVIVCSPDISGIIAKYYAAINRKKYIIWLESTFFNEKNTSSFKRIFRRDIIKSANSILIPGSLTEEYIKSFNIQKKVYIAYNSIDLPNYLISDVEFSRKFNDVNIINLTFSGSLVERKGITILLNAIEKLNLESGIAKYNFNILGEGPVAKRKIENVRYLGFVEGKEYLNLLKESHIFVMPSIYDCNPLTMIEAAASGNVLLASEAVGNHPELIRNNGIVFKVNDSDSLYDSLVNILKKTIPEIKKMALESIEISNKFSHIESAGQFVAAIKNAYAGKKN